MTRSHVRRYGRGTPRSRLVSRSHESGANRTDPERTTPMIGPRRFPFRSALVALALVASATSAAAGADRPNILWLIAEDFGTDLGCYGREQVWTPNLDKLAA